MKTLDLVKILSGCPQGTPLYSTIHGNVTLDCIEENAEYPIRLEYFDEDGEKKPVTYTNDGRYFMIDNAECTLFPSKTQRDWLQFQSPKKTKFAKGDHILWRGEDGEFIGVFAEYTASGEKCKAVLFQGERSGLFDVCAKDLTKLEKFDQKLLHTGDAVLVREGEDDEWSYTNFSHLTKSPERQQFYACGTYWRMCVPYNQETKHLIGTCYKAPEFYDLTDK